MGSIKETFAKYSHLENILPAMGYGEQQVRDLEGTLNAADCDVVVGGTPIDLNRLVKVNKPIIRVRYELEEIGSPTLGELLADPIGEIGDGDDSFVDAHQDPFDNHPFRSLRHRYHHQ